jgi:hypothetical protein
MLRPLITLCFRGNSTRNIISYSSPSCKVAVNEQVIHLYWSFPISVKLPLELYEKLPPGLASKRPSRSAWLLLWLEGMKWECNMKMALNMWPSLARDGHLICSYIPCFGNGGAWTTWRDESNIWIGVLIIFQVFSKSANGVKIPRIVWIMEHLLETDFSQVILRNMVQICI